MRSCGIMNGWSIRSIIFDVYIKLKNEDGSKGTVLILSVLYLFLILFESSSIFIARTLSGSPNRVMNPSASWWSYISPVVKLASDSL